VCCCSTGRRCTPIAPVRALPADATQTRLNACVTIMGRHKHSHWRRRSSSKQLTTSTLAVSALLTRCCCPQSATMCECKVHDFCVLPMNAALLALGGVIAYREKGSEVRSCACSHMRHSVRARWPTCTRQHLRGGGACRPGAAACAYALLSPRGREAVCGGQQQLQSCSAGLGRGRLTAVLRRPPPPPPPPPPQHAQTSNAS
jgi:hypothetical protein